MEFVVSFVGAKSYKIYIREKGRENSDSANMISVNDTSATVTSLAPGTPYVVRIYSVGSKNVDSAEGAQFETTTCMCQELLFFNESVCCDNFRSNYCIFIW